MTENKIYNWVKIDSSSFKHQLYHHDFKVFSWIQKDFTKSNLKKNKILMKNICKGTVKNNDLVLSVISIDNNRKNIRIHRLIYFILKDNLVSQCNLCKKGNFVFNLFKHNNEFSIDHIDGNHLNNNPNNIQLLCNKCHSKKTFDQTKNNRTCGSIKRSIKIVAYSKYDNNYKKIFNNAVEASKILELDSSSISRNVRNVRNYENNIIKWIGSYKHSHKYRFETLKLDEKCKEVEEWKKIDFLDGYVSNIGRVKNSSGISYGNKHNEYLVIGFQKKYYRVHILIMKTFKYNELISKANSIKNNKLYPECVGMDINDIIESTNKRYSILVDHIDGNKLNNNLENLRWVTQIENSENKKGVKLIEQWTIDQKILINVFQSQMAAYRETSVNNKLISDVCNGKKKEAGGFFWRFKI